MQKYMLEEKDIQKIGEEVGKVIEQNINPQFDEIRGRLDKVDGRLDKVEGRLDKVEGRLDRIDGRLDKVDGRLDRIETEMVTKSYLDDKLADIEGHLIGKLRKGDDKVNRLIEVLHNKSVLSNEDVEQLNEFQIFPKM